jgi:CheY-like chemotaxis protein
MAGKRVLSVGQCAADNWSITTTLKEEFGAEVVPVATEAQAAAKLKEGGFALVLLNRLFDGSGASGLDALKRLKALPGVPPLMLVSNYEHAQREAVAAGAVPGFGKATLGEAEATQALELYLR